MGDADGAAVSGEPSAAGRRSSRLGADRIFLSIAIVSGVVGTVARKAISVVRVVTEVILREAGGDCARRAKASPLASRIEIGHNDVVKLTGSLTAPRQELSAPAPEVSQAAQRRTREQVARLLHEHGAATAAELADRLGLSPAAVRRHLDPLVDVGHVRSREQRQVGPRGRGRPARSYFLTDHGRASFDHAYDDLATEALRYLAEYGGSDAVARFADNRLAGLEQRCRAAVAAAGDDPDARRTALAEALSQEGYAATTSTIAAGGQLCQHHCPVAHVAAQFPQLCEAETRVIGRLVGSHVTRLATIAHGDEVCTTHIPAARGRPVPPNRETSSESNNEISSANGTAPTAPITGRTTR